VSAETNFRFDVAVDKGLVVPAEKGVFCEHATQGMLVELPFHLPENTENFELRVQVEPWTKMLIHAVQVVSR